jgi:hypothetical protein
MSLAVCPKCGATFVEEVKGEVCPPCRDDAPPESRFPVTIEVVSPLALMKQIYNVCLKIEKARGVPLHAPAASFAFGGIEHPEPTPNRWELECIFPPVGSEGQKELVIRHFVESKKVKIGSLSPLSGAVTCLWHVVKFDSVEEVESKINEAIDWILEQLKD